MEVLFFYLLGCAIFSFSTNSTPVRIGRSKDAIFSRYTDICLWLLLQQVKETLRYLKMILGNILTKKNTNIPTSKSFQYVSNVEQYVKNIYKRMAFYFSLVSMFSIGGINRTKTHDCIFLYGIICSKNIVGRLIELAHGILVLIA